MQAAGNLVRGIVELTAGMQHGHDYFGRGTPFFRMDIHRNSTPVIRHGDGLVRMDGDGYVGAETRERLVDRVVDDLENHVVQAGAVVCIPDVHSGALSDRVEAL